MTKSQLIAAAAVRTGLPESEAACVLEAAEELILEALRRGEKVTIAGFGRFELRHRGEKAICEPQNGPAYEAGPCHGAGLQAQRRHEAQARPEMSPARPGESRAPGRFLFGGGCGMIKSVEQRVVRKGRKQ